MEHEAPGFWGFMAGVDLRTWGTGISGFILTYLAAVTGLRRIVNDGRRSRVDGDLALRGRLSDENRAVLDAKNADLADLRARVRELEDETGELRDACNAMEDWARTFCRHDFNNALTELDGVYRTLERVIAHPREDRAWEFAVKLLAARRAWPTPVVPSPSEARKRP